jgi:protein-L-isoaspartate(D-aspartate) O-methyltransferase
MSARNLRYRKSGLTAAQQDFHLARRRMVESQLAPDVRDLRVLDAMAKVPRHLFVEEGLWDQAYSDRPLPIGEGQTISQPKIVATMTAALGLKGGERILEIGTGCGYQTAVLCELGCEVFSIERIAALSHRARRRLYELGFIRFQLRVGDGTLGWAESAPFDCILVTAGAPVVPEALREQLADGGRLLVPVGGTSEQRLLAIRRMGQEYREVELHGCRFVKLIGAQGWKST